MAERNLIKKEDVQKVRELDFILQFTENVKKLMEVLGTSRMIPVTAGTVLKAYVADGTLEDGVVGEGELIPLSKYSVKPVPYGEAKLNKWRKATSAEAILKSGYSVAVGMTNDKMLKQVQNGIRSDYFTFLATGEGEATGSKLQPALANAWGKLAVLFEDNAVDTVYFLNPMDVAEYLGTAQISTQTVFGMTYIENFLGLGDVFLNASVPQGTFYATAKENAVVYYVPANGEDGLGEAFDFRTDETGLIGIHEIADYGHMTSETVVISGIDLFAERIDGVVVGVIGGEEQTTAEA